MFQVTQPPKLVRENRAELRLKERFEQLRVEPRKQRAVQHRIQVKVEVKVEVKTQRATHVLVQVTTRPKELLPELPDMLRRVLREMQAYLWREAHSQDSRQFRGQEAGVRTGDSRHEDGASAEPVWSAAVPYLAFLAVGLSGLLTSSF